MSSSMEVGMMPTSDTSRYTDDANSEAIEEVEDEIPELISGFPAEVRENDAEGESDQEDDEEQHLSSRQLFGLARSAPPGSLGHLNNSYELNAQGGRRVAFRGGREVFLDSDEGTDEYDAYVGEEFEGELDEDGNLIPHSDDYEVSNAYHHLRFYGGLLGHDIDDGDEDGDDCREVSDVDEDDYAPDLLSDQEADEIADCISDDGRDCNDDGDYMGHGGCPHFATNPEYGELHRAFANRADRYDYDSRQGDSRLDFDSARDKGKSVFTNSGSWKTGCWLSSDLFCSSALPKKKPSVQVQSVLEDRDWITSLLGTLPGVNPQDSSIQAVLASLRGEALPNSPGALQSKKPL
ncbi:hypothetical protein CYMTET_24758 [Cymbomonas tetramitiformis]|uniref:Uncharacterized protein n=1 Tax=Cymbomonas tetramitiformis TaxID=36881 RepID=A0AAE0KZL1_9CHLO|nr:hypothetical protein CYMTET_24758 [Cymbomonas tetramitiformis]